MVESTFLNKYGPCSWFATMSSVLWISSPRGGSFSKLLSELHAITRYVPPWEEEELINCLRAGCTNPRMFGDHDGSNDDRFRQVKDETIEALDDDADEQSIREALLRRWI